MATITFQTAVSLTSNVFRNEEGCLVLGSFDDVDGKKILLTLPLKALDDLVVIKTAPEDVVLSDAVIDYDSGGVQ